MLVAEISNVLYTLIWDSMMVEVNMLSHPPSSLVKHSISRGVTISRRNKQQSSVGHVLYSQRRGEAAVPESVLVYGEGPKQTH